MDSVSHAQCLIAQLATILTSVQHVLMQQILYLMEKFAVTLTMGSFTIFLLGRIRVILVQRTAKHALEQEQHNVCLVFPPITMTLQQNLVDHALLEHGTTLQLLLVKIALLIAYLVLEELVVLRVLLILFFLEELVPLAGLEEENLRHQMELVKIVK